ncbi:MAG: C39 family peptidase [Patescibacteria group bacterium]|nr:C39 family peptidase [Patescibacteria group bacterium]
MIKKQHLIIFVLFFTGYTFFWVYFFKSLIIYQRTIGTNSLSSKVKTLNNQEEKKEILSAQDASSIVSIIPTMEVNLPENSRIELIPRKQAYNLSCEFASAATIIHHFKNDSSFSPEKEKEAEEILMREIGVSDNPNIGIRMGKTVPDDDNLFYRNLNEKFGGEDYYGVHAPPFIDLFKGYQLTAKPLNKNKDFFQQIKQAVFSGHLVMVWMNVGYGKPVDLALSYGSVKAVRGEHSVVINGYDKDGLIFMDPGSGKERYLSYVNFLEAAKDFAIPFLEVYPSDSFFEFDPSGPIDIPTGLNRKYLKLRVENVDKKIGAKSMIVGVLHDFGYNVAEVEDIDCLECGKVQIRIKRELKDYARLLKKDLELAYYIVDSILTDLPKEASADAIIRNSE